MRTLTESDLGELARLPLCPKCGDTKYVEAETTIKLSVPYRPYKCTKCDVRWESICREWNNNGFPPNYHRSCWGGF